MTSSVRLAFALILVMFAALGGSAARAEDAAARDERLNGLIESLNALSARRTRVVEAIYNELKGPNAREMQEMLRVTLRRSNSLIVQGVIEAMAMHGDVRDVEYLEAVLAATASLEVKTTIIRLLPAFCLGTERARFNYIAYAIGGSRASSAPALAPLKRPPLTRRGRLDPALDRLRTRIASTLAGQFDPVAEAIRYAADPILQATARATVVYYVDNALGNNPHRWREIWDSQAGAIPVLVPEEVEEIRVAALTSLSDMGAEGLPDIIAAFRTLGNGVDSILSQAAFDAMGEMCRNAFAESRELAKLAFEPEDALEGGAWRARRLESAINLAVFASERAGYVMTAGADSARFASAANCLGLALSYPPDFLDFGDRLASARFEGMMRLERLLMMPDLSREKRAAIVGALGMIGLRRAASSVMSILQSPYASPEFGPDGMRLAETAIDALRNIATGEQDGRRDAQENLLALLSDPREFPPVRSGGLPVGMAHMVLWRLQRLAKTTDSTLDPEVWRNKLGW